MRGREPFILEAGLIALSASDTYLETSPIPNNKLFTCMSLAAIDMSHGIGTRLELGIVDGRAYVPIRSKKGPFPLKTSGNAEYPVMVLPGQRLYALFVTPSAGDDLRLYGHGYLTEVKHDEKRSFCNCYVKRRDWYYFSRSE